jgi:hypothetical protein
MAAAKTIKTFNIGVVTEPVRFNIDEDEYEAIPANRLPAGSLAKYFEAINDNRLFEGQELFFKAVLTETSYKLYEDRINSTEKPITLGVLGEVSSWLLGEVYLQGEATEESKPS